MLGLLETLQMGLLGSSAKGEVQGNEDRGWARRGVPRDAAGPLHERGIERCVTGGFNIAPWSLPGYPNTV